MNTPKVLSVEPQTLVRASLNGWVGSIYRLFSGAANCGPPGFRPTSHLLTGLNSRSSGIVIVPPETETSTPTCRACGCDEIATCKGWEQEPCGWADEQKLLCKTCAA